MTLDEMEIIFDKYNHDECLKFDRVENKLSTRPEIHGLIILNTLDTGDISVIIDTDYDGVWLSFDTSVVSKNITKDQIIDLIRCGITYDSGYNGFIIYI